MNNKNTKVELTKNAKVIFLKALKDGFVYTEDLAKALNIIATKSQVVIFELPDNGRDKNI